MVNEIVDKIRAFNRFYTSFIGLTNNNILQSDYSLTEVRVMFEANNNPGITARQLKTELRIDEGYLSRLVTKLVNKKILLKNQSKVDKRVYGLELTTNGKKIFAKLNQRSSKDIAVLIQHLNNAEKKELLKHLNGARTLLTNIKNNEA
jgi:DNA-binding MarR family transcriptional regulator